MDVDWSLEALENWLRLRERVPIQPGEGPAHQKTRQRGTLAERSASDHVVQSIWTPWPA